MDLHPDRITPPPGNRGVGMSSKVLVHPALICQIGESDQGLSELSVTLTLLINLRHVQSLAHLKISPCQLYNWRVADVAAAFKRMKVN